MANIQSSRFISLIQRILQGEPRWQWAPILLARVSLGAFFAISGWNKLFSAKHGESLLKTMVEAGIPFPEFMSVFLASVECFGGMFLIVGFLSTFCSIALTIAMIVAIVTVEIHHAIPAGLGPLDWLDWFLYLPQVLYVIMFVWLIITGPGPVSVDHMIARRLGVEREDGA
ncbi:MAG: DoxX family protein [Rhodospirillaceae bacterium]|jgi:putative oxidoreductase|nr:DoxX family protein [Rhodospirillales bacterium]MBT3907244.1 DoxX family protein [Rhodospirillaceae bacterium]MBT4703728.1 DoxX family protein [Rhodospirillaceae bacterium]MBT5036763.1 DoxX family protein [Rhodospirillaceae bacterium]MBT6220354.1 DoxX family protein [Rhodospirillaceae bacterium]